MNFFPYGFGEQISNLTTLTLPSLHTLLRPYQHLRSRLCRAVSWLKWEERVALPSGPMEFPLQDRAPVHWTSGSFEEQFPSYLCPPDSFCDGEVRGKKSRVFLGCLATVMTSVNFERTLGGFFHLVQNIHGYGIGMHVPNGLSSCSKSRLSLSKVQVHYRSQGRGQLPEIERGE
jgi:hypothetical protein